MLPATLPYLPNGLAAEDRKLAALGAISAIHK
jgi:hypothetical protein